MSNFYNMYEGSYLDELSDYHTKSKDENGLNPEKLKDVKPIIKPSKDNSYLRYINEEGLMGEISNNTGFLIKTLVNLEDDYENNKITELASVIGFLNPEDDYENNKITELASVIDFLNPSDNSTTIKEIHRYLEGITNEYSTIPGNLAELYISLLNEDNHSLFLDFFKKDKFKSQVVEVLYEVAKYLEKEIILNGNTSVFWKLPLETYYQNDFYEYLIEGSYYKDFLNLDKDNLYELYLLGDITPADSKRYLGSINRYSKNITNEDITSIITSLDDIDRSVIIKTVLQELGEDDFNEEVLKKIYQRFPDPLTFIEHFNININSIYNRRALLSLYGQQYICYKNIFPNLDLKDSELFNKVIASSRYIEYIDQIIPSIDVEFDAKKELQIIKTIREKFEKAQSNKEKDEIKSELQQRIANLRKSMTSQTLALSYCRSVIENRIFSKPNITKEEINDIFNTFSEKYSFTSEHREYFDNIIKDFFKNKGIIERTVSIYSKGNGVDYINKNNKLKASIINKLTGKLIKNDSILNMITIDQTPINIIITFNSRYINFSISDDDRNYLIETGIARPNLGLRSYAGMSKENIPYNINFDQLIDTRIHELQHSKNKILNPYFFTSKNINMSQKYNGILKHTKYLFKKTFIKGFREEMNNIKIDRYIEIFLLLASDEIIAILTDERYMISHLEHAILNSYFDYYFNHYFHGYKKGTPEYDDLYNKLFEKFSKTIENIALSLQNIVRNNKISREILINTLTMYPITQWSKIISNISEYQ